MKKSSCLIFLLLAMATVARSSAAAARESSSRLLAASVGSEIRGFFARAGGILGSAGRTGVGGWRLTKAKGVGARRARASMSCVPPELCKKKKVICSKKCYKTRAGVNHIPTKCVVKCKKCVPSC